MPDRSLTQKLFLKPGFEFLLINQPDGYLTQIGELPEGTILLSDSSCPVEAIQVFIANRMELEAQLPQLKELLAPKGMMWVTYHKGTSKVKTDINRDIINAYSHSIGVEGGDGLYRQGLVGAALETGTGGLRQ
jgi:hypothetical protein